MSSHPGATASTPRPLLLGMVGGGTGSFIGPVHRTAATLDGCWTLVAGALSSTPERSIQSARAIGLSPDRAYGDWREMLKIEAARAPGERIDALAIVTPNSTHAEIAEAFARAGFHLIIDKPMATDAPGARRIAEAARDAGVLVMVTYNYTGYPMVRRARELVRAGELGQIRKVFVEYHQGWLATRLEHAGGPGHKQASWRQDPALAGPGGAIADIGTHAENLLSTITGLEIESLCADLSSLVPGRTLDDDASVLVRFHGGARGVLTASQVCIGDHNALSIRIHGDKGSLRWEQQRPERLVLSRSDGSTVELTRGQPPGKDDRLPPGHPEGFLEAFANLYREFAEHVRAAKHGQAPADGGLPNSLDGRRGVAFLDAVLRSARAGGTWTTPFLA